MRSRYDGRQSFIPSAVAPKRTETMDTDQPPAAAAAQRKPFSRPLWLLAMGSWIAPLVAVDIPIMIDWLDWEYWSLWQQWVDDLCFCLLVLLSFTGFIFAIVGLIMSRKYQRLIWHSLGGTVASGPLAALLVVIVWTLLTS